MNSRGLIITDVWETMTFTCTSVVPYEQAILRRRMQEPNTNTSGRNTTAIGCAERLHSRPPCLGIELFLINRLP